MRSTRSKPGTELLFFGGKGGVGKTTCAAARAVVEAARGRNVLVVSTDPAHSLGDVFQVRLSAGVKRVARGLGAMELDARRAFARWLGRHRRALGDILEQGTWLDREDVEALLDLSVPGLDELAGLLEIARLCEAGDADAIVVDTAPTGHTLRLFAAPETVAAVVHVLDSLHATHRLIRDQLARVGRPEASDRLIALLADQTRTTAERLRDRSRTAIVWVSIAEELAVRETADAIDALVRAELPIDEIVVNRAVPDGPGCPICDVRRVAEGRAIETIRRGVGRGRRIRVIEEASREPRGIRELARIGKRLTGPAASPKSEVSSLKASRRRTDFRLQTSDVRLEEFFRAKLLFFGGKGGVGKTTVAAAAALRLAAVSPHRRVLLMSTDPAHSLADVFDQQIDDTPTVVRGAPPNLRVRELDAARAFLARRAALEAAVAELSRTIAPEAEGRTSELLELAPPGVDELFGMLSVFAAGSDFDRILVDTAPTGHALRLLEMPGVVQEWVQLLMRVLLKYRSVVAPGMLGAELVDLSQSIRQLRQMMADAGRTGFVVVTRMADVPAAETARLLTRLRRLKLAVPAIMSNAMTLSPGRCPRCRRIAAGERRRFAKVRRAASRCAIIQTPLDAPPPRGVRALQRWQARWMLADG